MKCPHCEYEHGWSSKKLDTIEGEHGEFYEASNSIVMERRNRNYVFNAKDTKTLHGCPSCEKFS